MTGTGRGGTAALALVCVLWAATGGPALAQSDRAVDVLRVGSIISLSGPNADIAHHVLNGYRLAARRVNDLGGIRIGNRAYRLELEVLDDESRTAVAGDVAVAMIRGRRLRYLLGPSTSSLVIAVQDVTEPNRVPMVQGGAALRIYSKDNRYTFGVLSSADQYLAGAVDLAATTTSREGADPRSLKAALAFGGGLFHQGIRSGVVERLENWGIGIALDRTLPDRVDDLSDLLAEVTAGEPDLLLFSGGDDGARALVRQVADLHIDVPMIALTYCDGAGIEDMGRRADYLVCASQWDPAARYKGRWFGSPMEFVVEFELEYDYTPPYQAAVGAAMVLTFADAFERAGTLDPERVRDALARTNISTFFGNIRFDNTGRNIAKPMVLQQIQGGRYQVVWPEDAASARFIHPMPRWRDR